MDPNVHQMMVGRNDNGRRFKRGDGESDDDEVIEHRSDLTGNRTVIITGGIEPKIEMKKKIARQSDLIHSLELNEVRKSSELIELRKKVRQQEEVINSIKGE